MAMQAKLWTLSGAATELGRDIRMLGAALAGVPPDGKIGSRDGYLLKTILAAIDRREAGGSDTARTAACNDIERIKTELQAGIEAARAEPNLAKRRALITEFGPNVGRLLQVMETAAAGVRPAEGRLLKIVREQAIGQIIGEIAELGGWDLSRICESDSPSYD